MNEVFLPPFVVNEINPVLPQTQTVDWGTNVLGIPEIHGMGITGKNVRVAVIDTGIDKNHPDLIGAIIDIVNVTGENMAYTNGHGIGCAGVIGARNNEKGVLGAAPDCQIIGIKAMRESGGGSIAEIVRGIRVAIERNVHVINLSLGASVGDSELQKAVEDAVSAGIYVVCSAGNAGQDNSVVYPARYPVTYAVGATNQSGNVSAFSSRGWEVDIAAPGERILTTWKNRGYARVSGTSFSAPYVSGLFALFIEAELYITHDRLKATAIDIEEPGQDIKSGHGLINGVRFIKNYQNIATQSPTPSPSGDLAKIREAHRLLGEFLGL